LHISLRGTSKFSFAVTPVVIILIVGIVSSGVLLCRQISSLVAFRDAQLAITQGNTTQASQALIRANEFSERDIYHRAFSNLALLELQQLSGQKLSQEEIAQRANTLVGDARTHAERAIVLDETNFENYLQLGGVYDTLGALGVQNTSGPARENYLQALRLNPKSPRILFVLARLEYVAGDRAKAKEYLHLALAERPNFLEAVSFLVQLELQDKNPDAAVGALETAVLTEPTNFLLRFALGYMYFSRGGFTDAIGQFEAAVYLNPVYADAKYFLGLSYARVNRIDEAVAQFADVQTLNPENKDIVDILKNLKAGRDPFDRGFVAPSQPVDDALEGLNGGKGGE
jgi:tetratricopeptide (TPR) repeat protein